nr:MAG TPA: hypothetical protein [Caudoviricetes sp.]
MAFLCDIQKFKSQSDCFFRNNKRSLFGINRVYPDIAKKNHKLISKKIRELLCVSI